jgi:hypothetical protein
LNFNKKLFADYLIKAKGNRSINKYGAITNVDPGYISRLIRQMIAAPPSAEIIKKLASKAYGDVTNEQLLSAAGYLDLDNDESSTDFSPLDQFISGYEKLSKEDQQKAIKELVNRIIENNK